MSEKININPEIEQSLMLEQRAGNLDSLKQPNGLSPDAQTELGAVNFAEIARVPIDAFQIAYHGLASVIHGVGERLANRKIRVLEHRADFIEELGEVGQDRSRSRKLTPTMAERPRGVLERIIGRRTARSIDQVHSDKQELKRHDRIQGTPDRIQGTPGILRSDGTETTRIKAGNWQHVDKLSTRSRKTGIRIGKGWGALTSDIDPYTRRERSRAGSRGEQARSEIVRGLTKEQREFAESIDAHNERLREMVEDSRPRYESRIDYHRRRQAQHSLHRAQHRASITRIRSRP